MSRSWLAAECRHQAVLFLAAEAFAARRHAGTAARRCPRPLLVSDSQFLEIVEQQSVVFAGDTTTTAMAICSWVDAMFQQHADGEQSGVPSSPWTRAELTLWWLAGGEALALMESHQRAALARVTRTATDPMHPALWCAERFDRMSLSVDVFREESCTSDWRVVATSPVEYRKKLFTWVMSPDRERPALAGLAMASVERIAALNRELREIGEDAVALFGKGSRLRVGGPLSLATADKWIAIWTASTVGGRALNEIRRPVIYPTAEGGSRHLVKGVAVVPSVQRLCEELATRLALAPGYSEARGVSLPALSRATEFARACWRPGEVLSKLWRKPDSAETGGLNGEAVERGFLAVARWLTAAWISVDFGGADESGDELEKEELVESARVALAIEGFQVEPRSGSLPTRLIPHGVRAPHGPLGLFFVGRTSAFGIPLGCLGERATCSDALFAAIEAVDWRLWAYAAAPWSDADAMAGQILDLLRGSVLRSDDWELIKRRALQVSGGPADEDPLACLFDHAQQRRMAVDLLRARVFGDGPAGTMLDGLIREYGELARVSLEALAAVEPAALRRLDPPRRTDGVVDLPAWLARGGPAAESADDSNHSYRVRWIRGPQPRGDVLAEQRVGRVVEVQVSAGDAADTELAMLAAPALSPDWRDGRSEETAGGLATLLADFRAKLVFPPPGGVNSLSEDPLTRLRTRFAGEAAAAFHELIARSLAGDEAAAAWCGIMRADSRFDFVCHPGFDPETGSVSRPGVEDSYLTWEFDATVPAGQDLTVRFAMTPAGARRVISLGPRYGGKLADRADRLGEVCRRAGGSLGSLGEDARVATFRWLTFGASAPHPITVIEPLLDELLQSEAVPPASRTGVFEAAAEWCEALDHSLLPSEWRADDRLLAGAFTELALPPNFDERVPTGTVAVRRFGLRGLHGRPFLGAVSAGPAPPGHREFGTAVERLVNSPGAGHNPLVHELGRRFPELPKHAIAGTLPLALPNLFDRLWEAIASLSETSGRTLAEEAVPPLFEMLKVCCRMIPFEPAKIGDYSAGWVREADGSQPKGRRIKRLVRPGLRTVENVLVRPALVITE